MVPIYIFDDVSLWYLSICSTQGAAMLSAEESRKAATVLDSAYELVATLSMEKEEPLYLQTLHTSTALKQRVHPSNTHLVSMPQCHL